MNAKKGSSRAVWLCVAWLVAGCSTTTGGGGGGGAPDVASDLGIVSFGSKDVTTGNKDTGTSKDTKPSDVATLDDSATDDAIDDTTPDDTGLDDATDFTDDVPVVDIKDASAPKDTGAPKDTVTKDTGSKDTGPADVGNTDVPGTCGNGTCDPGETCENCALECSCTPCNPLTSAGCKAPNPQCYVGSKGPQCGGPGAVADGGACTYLNDCALGSLCVGAICRKICATVGSNASLGCTSPALCEELANGATSLGYNLGACFAPDNCNLVTSVGCPSGQSCLPATNGKQCTPAGKIGLNGVCKTVADCDVGFLCLNNGATSGTCKKRCNTTDASTCPAGLTCGTVSIGEPPVLIGENFGVCN